MKYVMTYTMKTLTEEERKTLQAIFAGWSPPDGVTLLQFVHRVDGKGGTIVGETDDITRLLGDTALYQPYMDIEIDVVVDAAETVPHVHKALDARAQARAAV